MVRTYLALDPLPMHVGWYPIYYAMWGDSKTEARTQLKEEEQ